MNVDNESYMKGWNDHKKSIIREYETKTFDKAMNLASFLANAGILESLECKSSTECTESGCRKVWQIRYSKNPSVEG